MKSESIKELAKALSKVQGELRGYQEKSTNPFFKSKYGDLASVWAAVRGPLSLNGLAVSQTMHENSHGVVVVTTLMHTSGEWIEGTLFMKPVKDDPQGIGSAITYARRYALAAIVGVAPEDDDGNDASRKPEPRKPAEKKDNPQKKADRTAKPKWLVAMSKKADKHEVPKEHRKDWIEACIKNPKRLDLATVAEQKQLGALLDLWIAEKECRLSMGDDTDPSPFPPEPDENAPEKGTEPPGEAGSEEGTPDPGGLSEGTLKALYDIAQNNPEIPNTKELYVIAETFAKRRVSHLDELTEEEAQKMIKRLSRGV